MTEEKILVIAKNSIVIVEIKKIKKQYLGANWDKWPDILGQLNKFINHSNHRLALDIFEFLSLIPGQIRGGMTYDLGTSVFGIVLDFFPSFYDEEKDHKQLNLLKNVFI